jgi:hypothetical protein
VEIHRSAFKHGVDIDAIEHAVDLAVVMVIHVMALRPTFYDLLPPGDPT